MVGTMHIVTLQILATEKLPAEFQSTVCDNMWQYATVWALVSSGLLSTCPWVNKQLNQLNYSWIKSEALWFVWCCSMFLHATWMHSGFVFWQVSDSDCGPPLPSWLLQGSWWCACHCLRGREGWAGRAFASTSCLEISRRWTWVSLATGFWEKIELWRSVRHGMLKCWNVRAPRIGGGHFAPCREDDLDSSCGKEWQGHDNTRQLQAGRVPVQVNLVLEFQNGRICCHADWHHNTTEHGFRCSLVSETACNSKKVSREIERIWNFFFVWSSPFSCENAWVNSERLKLTDFDYK